MVAFRDSLSLDDRARVLSQAGVQPTGQSLRSGARVVQVEVGQEISIARQLAQTAGVAYAEPDYLVHIAESRTPTDPLYDSVQWSLPKINMPDAWGLTVGASTVRVAVIDTGITSSHPDLESQWALVLGKAPNDHVFLTSPLSQGCSAPSSPIDDNGHGTLVSGIIAAASTLTGAPAVGMAGVAPGIRVVPLKALDCQGSGRLSDVANAIDFAADSGISIINLSVSGQVPNGCPSYLLAAINRALQAGTVIVGAVGNNGSTDVEYPSGCTGVVGVGATDNTDAIWSFSNRNAAVALTAPGVSIESSWKDGNFAIGDGTSLSAPHVAGCAALIRSLNPALSAAATRQVLQSTAVDLGTPGYDTTYGTGRLDCGAAVRAATTGPIGTTPTPVTTPGGSAGKGLTITSGNGGVTLSWQAGTGQTGFSVVRLVNGQVTVLPPGGLPATATTYVDTAAPPGFDCYALLVNGPGTVGVSDLECAMAGFGAGTAPPQDFALRLNQSSTATLTWAPSTTIVDSYLVVPLNGTPQSLPGSQTSATVPLNGLGCFTVISVRGGAIQGYTDLLCGLPGFSNLGAASVMPTALAMSAGLRP